MQLGNVDGQLQALKLQKGRSVTKKVKTRQWTIFMD